MSRLNRSIRVATLATLFLSTSVVTTLRAQEGAHLTLQDLVSGESIGNTVLSPDGATIAISQNGQIALMPAIGGWPELITSTVGGKSGFTWSPDGKRLAFASQGGIWTVSAAGGAPRRLTNAPPGSG